MKKMKKVISFSRSLKSSLKQWVGAMAQRSTSTLSVTGSCCAKSSDQIAKKLMEVIQENKKLKEEIKFLYSELSKEFDL